MRVNDAQKTSISAENELGDKNRLGCNPKRFKLFLNMEQKSLDRENGFETVMYPVFHPPKVQEQPRFSEKLHSVSTLQDPLQLIVARMQELAGSIDSLQLIEKRMAVILYLPVIGMTRVQIEYRKPAVNFCFTTDPSSGYWTSETKCRLVQNLGQKLSTPIECQFHESNANRLNPKNGIGADSENKGSAIRSVPGEFDSGEFFL